MTYRPILFSAPMVRAILDGRKTQTRRVIKSKDALIMRPIHTIQSEMQEHLELLGWRPLIPGHLVIPCSYGQPGDRLWVRETFCDARLSAAGRILYRADGDPSCKWTPSIYMPRWASRITLDIDNVRVERLQDISDKDALSEGVDQTNTSIGGYATERFKRLWQTINGPGIWDANPWVWVIEFKRGQP